MSLGETLGCGGGVVTSMTSATPSDLAAGGEVGVAGGGGGGDPAVGDFAGDLLRAHNAARARHGAAPLCPCPALGVEARAWAEHLLERRALKHSDTSHGENLYYRPLGARGQGHEPGGKEVTEHWYSELKHYDFSSPGYKPNTVHFTQLVWRASCRLGVGRACDGRRLIVVTLYSPPGNQGPQGAFRANVLPPCPVPPPLPVLPVLPVPPPLVVLLPPLPADEAPCPVLPQRAAPPASPDATEAKEADADGRGASDFQQDMLFAHNALRRRHGVRPLVLSAELCAGAQLRAEALLLLLMEPHGGQQTAGPQAEKHTRPRADEAEPGSVTTAEVETLPGDKQRSDKAEAETLRQDNERPHDGRAGSSRVDIHRCGDTLTGGAAGGHAGQQEEASPPVESARGKPRQLPDKPQPDKLRPGEAPQPDQLRSSDARPDRIQPERSHQSKPQSNKAERREGLAAHEPRPDEPQPEGSQQHQPQPAGLRSNDQRPAAPQCDGVEADEIGSNKAQARQLQAAELQPSVVRAEAVQGEVVQAGGTREGVPPSWDAAAIERESRPGENIYLGVDAARSTASVVTDAWYNEIGRHNFDILSPQPDSARFCQLVWRSSRRLGVGRAVGPRGRVVIVAVYDPPAHGGDSGPHGGGRATTEDVGPAESPLVGADRESDDAARVSGRSAREDAPSETAPTESVPKSVSFYSLDDVFCATAPSTRSDDTDAETEEESSGTETLVMDSDRTTCEIMDVSEAEATEELSGPPERAAGGAGPGRGAAAGCERAGSRDAPVSQVPAAEKLTAASPPTDDADGTRRAAAESLPRVAAGGRGGGGEPSDGGVASDRPRRRHSDAGNGTRGRVTVADIACRRSSGAAKAGTKAPGGSGLETGRGAAEGGVKAAKVAAKAGRRADAPAPGGASGSKVAARTPRAEVAPSKAVGAEVLIKATLVGDALQELYRRNVLPIVRSTPCTPQPHAQLHISEEDQEQFLVDMLAEHNRLREVHGTRALRRSAALSRDARAWARVLARSRALRSHPTVPHGQNVWAKHIGTGELPKGRKVTNCWYADRLAYDYNNPGFQQGTGNFSQLVWRSSLDLGVGLACDGRGMFVAVAFYSPAGNLPYAMSYRDNVLPPHGPGQA